ncbi:hypothetical protein BDQ12DRAFT_222240 [Crucibulum laeve]|uniref:Uncharacterized protein n=1 Tax=Crucibulum laeve TaxID=68775 RepID=A0A5C3LYA6_9AGAR|nr:hypothetical protein BDQ12DRAFT_222240 [Crucibulum laeve]
MLYHCLQDLQVASAAQIVAGCRSDAVSHLRDTLNISMIHANAQEKREFISALYLEIHRDIHRVLAPYHLESIIRLLNSQDIVPFVQWPSSFLLRAPDDIISQFLMCLKLLVVRNRIKPSDVYTIWSLIRRILVGPQGKGKSRSVEHIRLAFEIIGEFESWVKRESDWDVARIKLCVFGVTKVFPLPPDPYFSLNRFPEAMNGTSLLQTLENSIQIHGGAAHVLGPLLSEQWTDLICICDVR